MALAGEMDADEAFIEVAVLQRQAAGGVVRRHDDERVTVLRGPLEHIADRAVEIEQFLHRFGDVVPV